MLNEILKIADQYSQGLAQVKARKSAWLKKHIELKDHLKEIAEYLNQNTTYKQGYYVDLLHAFDEASNGTCEDMPSVAFRSGDMPMMVSLTGEGCKIDDFTEHGFSISFNPSITGEVHVLLYPHHNNLSKTTPEVIPMAVISDPETISTAMIDDLIVRCMTLSYYSSFTGITDLENQSQAAAEQPKYNPIGFKRYATTEKTQ